MLTKQPDSEAGKLAHAGIRVAAQLDDAGQQPLGGDRGVEGRGVAGQIADRARRRSAHAGRRVLQHAPQLQPAQWQV
jgi:hypothetical protein